MTTSIKNLNKTWKFKDCTVRKQSFDRNLSFYMIEVMGRRGGVLITFYPETVTQMFEIEGRLTKRSPLDGDWYTDYINKTTIIAEVA